MTPRQKSLAKACRSGATSSTRPIGSPSTDIRARAPFIAPLRDGSYRARKSPKMTATQRDSTGKRSAWGASPTYWTDPAWGKTVSEVRS